MSAIFKDKPIVSAVTTPQGNRQAKFERHVEPGCRRRRAINRHTREVMKRIPTLAQKTYDALQTSGTSWNLERRSGNQSKGAEAGDERQIHGFVVTVVGNVDERIVQGPTSRGA
jgi:hypothetical protein